MTEPSDDNGSLAVVIKPSGTKDNGATVTRAISSSRFHINFFFDGFSNPQVHFSRW